jgi:predicted house-cleaning noncanonical NTP pyrophosphatase (MazG superfamily)
MQRRKFLQNKLWRDKAHFMLQDTGSIIHTKKLDDEQFAQELRVKLLEETLEVQAATTDKELQEEIADVFEVLDTIMRLHNISQQEVRSIQQAKRELRGGLNDRIFVTVVEHLPGSFGEQYCLKDSLKYPEILD